MFRPIEGAILQRDGNVLLDSRLEIANTIVSESGVFKLADIETELLSHDLQASNAQIHVRILEVGSIVAGTVIAGEKIGNGQMPDTNSPIGPFISIQ